MLNSEKMAEVHDVACGAATELLMASEAAALWDGLVSGEIVVVAAFNDSNDCRLVLAEPEVPRGPLRSWEERVFRQVLLGVCRKQVGGEHGLSQARVTEILKATFARLGLECPANLAPQSLVLLAHRAQGRKVVTPLSCGRFEIAGKTLLVLRSSFEHAWMRVLRPAERVVARMWLAGRTHHVIAASRGTSYRTVVNHLSAVYRRLGVSGRLELARACVAHSAVATARRPPRIAAELGETRSSVIFAST